MLEPAAAVPAAARCRQQPWQRRRRRRWGAAAARVQPLVLLLLCGLLGHNTHLAAGFRPPPPPPPTAAAAAAALNRGRRGGLPSLLPSSAAGVGVRTGPYGLGGGGRVRPLASSMAMDPPSDDGEDAGSIVKAEGGEGAGAGAEQQQQQVVPSLGALLRFTIPTLGIWLAGPIMSLVRAICGGCG
jgi:hypothetical protein